MRDVVLMEAVSSTASTPYKKKYKCPFCELRVERSKLHLHIQDKHEELIPEGWTALRVAFNTINKKTEGHCIICNKVTEWNEDKGRYERLCGNPACKEAYKKMVADRNRNKYGTDRLQSDPRYAEEVQKRALAGRSISGNYKFEDGGTVPYVGSYEKRFLKFMDEVMKVESTDIIAPGPSIEYEWNGARHIYLPDFYYTPYNLIVEIKDGGDNPNKNPHMTECKGSRQDAKEDAVRKSQIFNYVRLTNNDFGQLISIMAVLKYNMQVDCYDPIVMVHESALLESAKEPNHLFLLSTSKDLKSLSPRVPDNFFTKHGYEDSETPRVCMCKSIEKCLMAMSQNVSDKRFYVYKPAKHYDTYKPTLKEVPDSGLTGEVWIREKVDLEYVGAIKAIDLGPTAEGHKFKYGDGKEAELYDWGYEWLYNHNESAVEESVLLETRHKSVVEDSYSPKGKKRLTEFKSINVTADVQKKYAKVAKLLAEADKDEFGKAWIDAEDNLVGYCMANDYGWLTAIEVSKAYRGFGLSDQILKYAIKNFGVNRLGVYKDNEVAIRLYKKNGFVEVPSKVVGGSGEKNMIFMTNDKSLVGLNESSDLTLSNLAKKKITNEMLKSEPAMKHIKVDSNCVGWAFYDDNNLVGFVNTEKKDNGEVWIQGLEVVKQYQNKGIGKKLLDFACKKLGAKYLSVNKKNDVAFIMYKKYGFKIYDETPYMYFMTLKVPVSEDMSGAIGAALAPWPVPYEANKSNYYIVQHPQNHAFAYGITKDPFQSEIFSVDPEDEHFYKVFKSKKGDLDKKYLTFKIKNQKAAEDLYNELALIYENGGNFYSDDTSRNYIYSTLTGGNLSGDQIISPDQLLFDSRFELVRDFDSQLEYEAEALREWLMNDETIEDSLKSIDEQLTQLEEMSNE